MDEQIKQLDTRLSSVERGLAVLTAQAEHVQLHYATKEVVAELRTEIVASELRLSKQIASLEEKILDLENRHLRWTVGAIVAVAGIVLAIVRTFP
nr:hypothetical protein [uncultured Duganella sp.]